MRRNSSCRRAQCLCEVQKWVIKTPALVSISLGVTIMKRKKRHFKILLTSDFIAKSTLSIVPQKTDHVRLRCKYQGFTRFGTLDVTPARV